MDKERRFLRSKQLAYLTGVSTDTLRYYERNGLIPSPSRSSNRYREYPTATLDRVLLIRSALCIGFTIRELGQILKERDGGGAPCLEVRDLARHKLKEIDQRLEQLTKMRNQLRSLLKSWNLRLARTPTGQRAGLLETLHSKLETQFHKKESKR